MDLPGPTSHVNSINAGKTNPRSHPSSTERLVAENVTQGSNGTYRCAIAGAGTCLFGLPKMMQINFACHFMRQHPKEAAEKGFLEQPGSPQESQSAAPLERFVVRTERGFCCQIDPDQPTPCDYVQEVDRVSAPAFARHFRQMHTALAKRYGFFKTFEPAAAASNRSLLRSNLHSFIAKAATESSAPKRSLVEECSEEDPSNADAWINTPSDEPSEYCRLCFSVAQPSRPIFSGPHDTASSCAALIAECTGIRLSAPEDHPAAICHECSEKLHDIKCFRMLCETLNRVVRRNRTAARMPSAVSSSPPPLVPIVEPGDVENSPIEDYEEELEDGPPPLVPFDEATITTSMLVANDDQQDDVVELLDSEEEIEIGPTEVPVEEPDDDAPYIELQDDWFCCKHCNQIHQTLDAMIDHIHNCHSEVGFIRKPKKAENPPKKKTKKSKPKAVAAKAVVDYQEVVVGNRTYYKCNNCDTVLSQKSNMARHRRTYHEGNAKSPKLVCRINGCCRSFQNKTGLSQHLKQQHNLNSCDELMASDAL